MANTGLTAAAAGSSRACIRIAFNRNQPPRLEDVYIAIEQAVAVGVAECTRCGFDGVDLHLFQVEILDPHPDPWVTTKTGGELQQVKVAG